jgi:hypothetical protein
VITPTEPNSTPPPRLVVRHVPRGKTESDAVAGEMHYAEENECPGCGCPWYANKDYCGEGHRTCYDCTQEWWEDIAYNDRAPRRDLPPGLADGTVGEAI